jgi:hypothetical protein
VRAGAVTAGGAGIGLVAGLVAWAVAHDILRLASWILRRPLYEQHLPGIATFLQVATGAGAFVAVLLWLFEK